MKVRRNIAQERNMIFVLCMQNDDNVTMLGREVTDAAFRVYGLPPFLTPAFLREVTDPPSP